MLEPIKLYGHAEFLGSDPHGRIIEISPGTAAIIDAFREEERRGLSRWEIGGFLSITDIHGAHWEVASAPCGQQCHCAAIIRGGPREGGV